MAKEIFVAKASELKDGQSKLVIDGKTGFTGGVGMGTEWHTGLSGLPPWRETHFKAEGPVVAQLQV